MGAALNGMLLLITILRKIFALERPAKKMYEINQSIDIKLYSLRGDTHMTSTLRGPGGKAKMRCYLT